MFPMPESDFSSLGPILKSRRREKRLTLRELADIIGVSINTLSRVENGHVPDLKTFGLIIEWLGLPAEQFLDAGPTSTTQSITRHLRNDPRLSPEAAEKLAEQFEEMYRSLRNEEPRLSLHLRSATTFTPKASALMASVLSDIQVNLLAESRE
jgi:transcriptional regulator with XRE-family HTH domain